MTQDASPRGGPLAGLKVIELATIVAAPSAASYLSDYGAEVLKIELPDKGDGLRNFPPFKDEHSLWWKVVNRDKQLITLDLRKPRGREIFKSLLPHYDVLIENFRPGTLARWGLDPDTLRQCRKDLIVLRATAFGQDGPYRDRPGFARIFEAMGGLTYISGEPQGAPMHAGYPIGDSIGALFAALGVMVALWRRTAHPQAPGEEIDLSMTEAMIKLLDFLPMQHDLLGKSQQRSGNVSQYAAPTGVYRTRDGGWVSLSGSTDALFAANCRAIGREDLLADPRYASNRARCKNSDEVNRLFEQWFLLHDQNEVVERFQKAHGTVAPVYSAEQVVNDPQVVARKFLQSVEDEDFGSVRIPGVVPRFRNSPCRIAHAARSMGADNETVYSRLLGISAAEQDILRQQGII
ncbi:CaiB/BaiF CoA transferase family protein [Candidimonas nitroreducens]|uniref:CaiB/BaiF CoA transferase family protein n=1 Tax=Candidimonas nitroreducens TaxID=683354 RepID=UPI001E5A0B99|nr:CoA transferase [Candidimonas nitroreducens]